MTSDPAAAAPRPDPALGVFDTMLVRDGHVHALALHLGRLAGAVDDLYGERLPADLAGRIGATASGLSGPHRLRIDAIPGAGALELSVTAAPADDPAGAPQAVTLGPALVARGIGPYKWRDRRLLDALTTDAAIPLILDDTEDLLEAASANVWIVEDRRLLTPPADGRLLAGVTRTLLLERAHTLGLDAAEAAISLQRARSANAIFLTSSIRLVSGASLADGTGPGPDEAALTRIRAVLGDAGWA